MFDLTGKIALITGATGGIGAAIAEAFHRQGATVALSGTRVEALERLRDTLKDRVFLFPCSLSDPEAVKQLIPQVESSVGGLHILVNNAGITKDGLYLRMKDEDFDSVLDVNLKAPFYLMRAALRPMMKNRWGRIINMTSIVGFMGNPGQVNYCATKAGLVGMSKATAHEVASRGITVNCIAPGFIQSPMTQALPPERNQALLSSIPMGAMGEPKDIAAAAVYLASPEAHYVTGQTLHVNGGMAMF